MFLSTLAFISSVLSATSSEILYNKAYVEIMAHQYSVDLVRINHIVTCESGYKHTGVYGDKGKAMGLFQFHRTTFEDQKKKYGKTWLEYEKMEDQTELAMMMMRDGMWSRWYNCSVAAGIIK